MTAAIMIQLITGAIGSVGFGILFHIKKKYLPLAAVGGFLSWLVFLLGKEFWGNVFLPTLMAGFVTDVYAEILARICKETSTSFFVTSVIPLIPGSTLYYCMNSIVEGNTVRALDKIPPVCVLFGIFPSFTPTKNNALISFKRDRSISPTIT